MHDVVATIPCSPRPCSTILIESWAIIGMLVVECCPNPPMSYGTSNPAIKSIIAPPYVSSCSVGCSMVWMQFGLSHS